MARRYKKRNKKRKTGRDLTVADPRSLKMKVYPITVPLTAGKGTVSGSTSNTTYGSVSINPVDFAKYASYAVVFDEYRVLQWQCRFTPVTEIYSATSGASWNTGLLHTCVDHNDDVIPASIDEVRSYSNHKYHYYTSMKPHIRTVPATCLTQVYGGVTPGYRVSKTGWLDTNYNDVTMYAVKYAQSQIGGLTLVMYNIECTAIFQFRRSK